MIQDRPTEIDSRSTVGHWEGDTVIGGDRHHCIVTLVERKTGFVIIKKIRARTIEEVNKACIAAINEHGRKFISITFDNGTEFHGYK
ncbi:MAG: IS30 family transposase [Spirochaetes bacterium]|nr:IS30 family transposase [Spirochaetota bacterium]